MNDSNILVEKEDYWISISDMMAVLMVIFMFIAISYMINVYEEKEQIEEIAKTYHLLKEELYNDLYLEFKDDLDKWKANIDKETLSIRFQEPEVFFGLGKSDLKSEFKEILDDFFPRYIKILNSEQYKDDIEEIRIEGHTSSEWGNETNELIAYFNNMELSQERTRSVLTYVMQLEELRAYTDWLINYLTANGLSSSEIILFDGEEDPDSSRRVEFRVRTKAEDRIYEILSRGDEK